jgi:hypothetical protein
LLTRRLYFVRGAITSGGDIYEAWYTKLLEELYALNFLGMNAHKASTLTRKKKKVHHVPKMSTEAQIVLQEIRSVNRQSHEGTAELQYLVVSPITGNTDKLPNVNSSTLSSAPINHNTTQELTKVARLKDIEYPFVLTLPGFDIRYNMTALRPVRESSQERERNICIQEKSIAKCREWLQKT